SRRKGRGRRARSARPPPPQRGRARPRHRERRSPRATASAPSRGPGSLRRSRNRRLGALGCLGFEAVTEGVDTDLPCRPVAMCQPAAARHTPPAVWTWRVGPQDEVHDRSFPAALLDPYFGPAGERTADLPTDTLGSTVLADH